MEYPHEPAVIRPDRDYKLPLVVMTCLFVLAAAVAGYYLMRGLTMMKRINELESQVSGVEQIEGEYDDEVDAQNIRYSELVGAVNAYLRTQEISCIGQDIKECLANETQKEIIAQGPACSATRDNECPFWCSAEDDYDCCVAKAGFEWSGGECVAKAPSPTPIDLFLNTESGN